MMVGTLLIYVVFGVVFTAFAALVFCVLTLLLGKLSPHFELSGPDDWKFHEFYVRYLIIAAVFTCVSLPLGHGLLGIAALAVAYKFVFDAGWPQAIVIGGIGGVIALVLFVFILVLILQPLGLLEAEPSQDSFQQFDESDIDSFGYRDGPLEQQGRFPLRGSTDRAVPLVRAYATGTFHAAAQNQIRTPPITALIWVESTSRYSYPV
jgi:hypothetical protein